MGSPTIFNGRRTKLLTADGVLTSAGRTIDYDGAINYIPNSGAKIVITGYNAYANTAQAAPVNGTGGAPTVTVTRSTVTPLFGPASILFTKPASNVQGNGFSYDFAIDSGVSTAGTPCTITGYYNVASGTFANGDMTIWIYDITNGVVIQPTGSTINNNIGAATIQCAFQPATNSTSYRLIFQVSSVSALAYTVQFDTLAVRPNTYNVGAVVTATVAYTPTFSGFGTVSGVSVYSRRVGDSLEVWGTATCGTPTATAAQITLGYNGVNANVTTDSGKIGNGQIVGGMGTNANASSNTFSFNTGAAGGTNFLYFGVQSASSSNAQGANGNALIANAGANISFFAKVPILGWGVTQVLSSDTDTRVVAASYKTISSTTVTNGTAIKHTAINYDTHSAYNTATGEYTAPVAGKYRGIVTGLYVASGSQYDVSVYVNGVSRIYGIFTIAVNVRSGASFELDLFAGDKVTIIPLGSITLGDTSSTISYSRLSGPTQIAASEKIYLQYTGNAGGVQTADVTNVDFTTKVIDSHGAWNGTVFTAPRPGWYDVKSSIYFTVAASRDINVWINGVKKFNATVSASDTVKLIAAGTYLNAGDTLSLRTDTPGTLSNSAIIHWIAITSQG